MFICGIFNAKSILKNVLAEEMLGWEIKKNLKSHKKAFFKLAMKELSMFQGHFTVWGNWENLIRVEML